MVAICRAVDGIPLALELAASRLRVLSAADLAGRLGDVFTALGPGGRARTLSATIDWSHDQLHEAELAMFARLSVFVGSWVLADAEAVSLEVFAQLAAADGQHERTLRLAGAAEALRQRHGVLPASYEREQLERWTARARAALGPAAGAATAAGRALTPAEAASRKRSPAAGRGPAPRSRHSPPGRATVTLRAPSPLDQRVDSSLAPPNTVRAAGRWPGSPTLGPCRCCCA